MAPRVLYIDGKEEVRTRVRALLERAGIAVEEAASGPDGIARALARPPDLVIVGVHLPEPEGYDVAAGIRREKGLAGVPVVALGASRREHEVDLAAGFDGVIDAADERLPEEVQAYLAGKRERPTEEAERSGLRQLCAQLSGRLEAALAQANRARDRAVELDRLKSAFMHDLAHELSTPLTPLAGYLRILQGEKIGTLAPQQRKILDAMIQSVGRLSRIVDNLADFASLQVGESAILEGDVDPDALADAVVAALRTAAKDARIEVVVQHAGGGPVRADGRKLRQAVENLVSNAVKFSPNGGHVLVELTRGSGKLRFAIYDQGPGIRGAEVERIFEPLYHARRSRDDARAPGTGLGLPVARRIAEAHGGQVYLESPPRTQPASLTRHFTGSKFVLEIPERPASRPDAGTGATPPAAAAP
jgi:signal transduction histidine kinase